MQILRNAQAVGLSAQINTTVTRHNAHLLPEMVQFVEAVGAVQWSVFFLVPTGRGQIADMISPEEHERIFHWLYDLSQRGKFDIKATAAPMYCRVAIERQRQQAAAGGASGPVAFQGAGFQYADGLHRPVKGVNDGRGFLFISHLGEIMPSGFLPLSAGNVRTASLARAYREAPLFRKLRDPQSLRGRCGECEFRGICAGSRSRAYALTGDPFATDPWCAYAPGPAPAARSDGAQPS